MGLTYKNITQLEQNIAKSDGAGLVLLFKTKTPGEYLVYVRNRPGVKKITDKDNKDLVTATLLQDRAMTGTGGKFTGLADDGKTPETRAQRMSEELSEETFGAFNDVSYAFVNDAVGHSLCHEVIKEKYSYTTAIAVASIDAEEFKKRLVAIDKTNQLLYPFGDFLINKMTFDAYKTTNGPAYSKEQAMRDAQQLMADYDNKIEAAALLDEKFLQLLPEYAEKEMRKIANGTSDLLNDLDKPAGKDTRRGLSFADGLLLNQASFSEPMRVKTPLANFTESNHSGFAHLSQLKTGKADFYYPDAQGKFDAPTVRDAEIWWNDDATNALLPEFVKVVHPEMVSNNNNAMAFAQ